ncbi:E3 ubiquitin-protein ligase rnf168 [Alosa sapidissima]|uniref:E3 ubiquitin-protein ligase rnf168 n=1 Tax=Alosa sapidissima TaxID=34773 RepID=UPI001C0840BC|nr:E3 ubiquitin-protein ligase rnf168 [Alosa sapidissima]
MPPVSEVEIAVPEEGAGGLSRSDCLCPVCLEIFLEPVTLPCTHTFCKSCFLETVDKSNMCCPLCRKRVSTWARLNNRKNTLVNVDLWQRIQNAFPEQCQRRLSGQEDDYSTILIATPKVCQPGELRREYEDEVSKVEKERRALEEAERRASEEYIQRLLAEDEQRLAEERRRQEENEQKDEWLARQISQELNSDTNSQVSSRPIEISPPQKKKPSAGDIQKFFGPVRSKNGNASDSSPTSSLLANKENIRNLGLSMLSPQRSDSSVSHSLPTLDYYGPSAHSSGHFPDHVSSSPCSPSSVSSSFSSSNDFEVLDATSPERSTSSASAKRKSRVMEEAEGEGAAATLTPKRSCGPPSVAAPGPSLLQQLSRQEEELQERRRQEEEDRQLALRLQREMDREERSRATDRSKSSTDPYELRQKTPRRSAATGRAGEGDDEEATPLTPNVTHSSPSQTKVQAAGSRRRPQADQGKTAKRRQSAPPAATAAAGSTSANSATTTTTTPTAAANSAATPLKKSSKQITITDLFNCMGR